MIYNILNDLNILILFYIIISDLNLIQKEKNNEFYRFIRSTRF